MFNNEDMQSFLRASCLFYLIAAVVGVVGSISYIIEADGAEGWMGAFFFAFCVITGWIALVICVDDIDT